MNKNELIIPAIALAAAIILGAFVVWNSGRAGRGDMAAPAMSTTTLATTTLEAPAGPGSRRPLAEGPHYAYGSVTLALNQAAGFASGLSIRPLSVVEDSRCPEGADCVQAGTVAVQVRATTNTFTQSAKTELVRVALGETVTLGGSQVTLSAVAPAPAVAGSFPSSAYRFTFTVSAPGADSVSAAGGCHVGGCSRQLCTDQPDAVSTCEFRAEYACYRTARCERQASGRCGWTETPALSQCLANPPAAE